MKMFEGIGTKVATFGRDLIANLKGQKSIVLLSDSVNSKEFEKLRKKGIFPVVVIMKDWDYQCLDSQDAKEELSTLYHGPLEYHLEDEWLLLMRPESLVSENAKEAPLHLSAVMKADGSKKPVTMVVHTSYDELLDEVNDPSHIVYSDGNEESILNCIYGVADEWIDSKKPTTDNKTEPILVKEM